MTLGSDASRNDAAKMTLGQLRSVNANIHRSVSDNAAD
jgi:hypothetical protein